MVIYVHKLKTAKCPHQLPAVHRGPAGLQKQAWLDLVKPTLQRDLSKVASFPRQPLSVSMAKRFGYAERGSLTCTRCCSLWRQARPRIHLPSPWTSDCVNHHSGRTGTCVQFAMKGIRARRSRTQPASMSYFRRSLVRLVTPVVGCLPAKTSMARACASHTAV